MSGEAPARGRELGTWSLLALGINGVVGVGIFFAPAKVAGLVPGPAGAWVYVLTVLSIAPVALLYALLGARFGEDGGPYVWARAALGSDVAYAVGWFTYVSAMFSTAAVMEGVITHLGGGELGLAAGAPQKVFAVVAILVLSGLVATGLRLSARVWSSITVLKLIPLVALVGASIALGYLFGGADPSSATRSGAVETPGAELWQRAMLVALFALQGFEIVPVPAGHVKNRARSVPLAVAGCLIVVIGLYVALHLTAVSTVPSLEKSPAPLVVAAGEVGGTVLSRIVGIGTHVSALGIAFGMFAMTPRYLAALGRDDALGAWLGRESSHNVPVAALVSTTSLVLALSLWGNTEELFALASVAVIVQYGSTTFSLAVLAWRRERSLRRIHLVPVPLVVLALLLLLGGAKRQELYVAAGVLASGLIVRYLRRALPGKKADG